MTERPWKPEGYTSISPYLIVRDALRALDFMEKVFGATRLRVMHGPDGERVEHAEARIDDSIVMMGEMREGPDANVHVYVPDVEAAFARAVAAGATVVQPLQRQGDGDHRGGVADGNGTVWWLSRQD